MMPIGYEFGFRRPLDVVDTSPEDWEEPAFDITDFITAVNRMKAETKVLNEEGPQERFTPSDAPLVGLLRREEEGAGRAAALINPDRDQARDFPVAELASMLEIEPVETKADAAASDARARYRVQIAALKKQRSEVSARLEELRNASEDAWEEIREGAQRASETFREVLDSARAKFD
jgi:hypothetical protein